MDEQIILEEELIAEERAVEAARLGAAIINQPIGLLSSLRPPVCVTRTTSVAEAVAVMNEHRTGCVLVTEDERLVGVFTERDVLTKVAGRPVVLQTTAIADLMTPDPECLTRDDGIAYALNLMSVGGFRHIPLVDAAHRPTGVVAMRDIVDFIVDTFPEAVLNLPPSPAHEITRAREGA